MRQADDARAIRADPLTRVFARHDADASGTIDAAELPHVMLELGIAVSDEKCGEVLKQLDVDYVDLVRPHTTDA